MILCAIFMFLYWMCPRRKFFAPTCFFS